MSNKILFITNNLRRIFENLTDVFLHIFCVTLLSTGKRRRNIDNGYIYSKNLYIRKAATIKQLSMFITSLGQSFDNRKIRQHDKDFFGIFFPGDLEIIRRVQSLADRAFSASLKSWNITSTITHCETLPDLSIIDKTDPFFLLEPTHSGTIADAAAKDDYTGISSPVEERSVPASIHGKAEAADIQDNGKNGLQITFSGRQFFVRTRCQLESNYLNKLNTKQKVKYHEIPHYA